MSYDQFLLALCLWREARGATMSAQTAIMWVILNRMKDPLRRWPATVPGVILQAKQFSSFNAGDPNSALFPQPAHTSDWDAWQRCMLVATQPLGGDPTNGATNYESCQPGQLPAWADPAKMTTEIGPFRFYAL